MKKTLKVYRASAGSGKTFTLAAEYIALLLSGGENAHRGLLAVTFTNAATAEMKQRILTDLFDLSVGVDGDFAAAVRQKMGVAPDTHLQKKASDALRELVHDYDHFSVTTIDSFFQRLLSSLGHELGLGADLRVDLDDAAVCGAAVERILASVASRKDISRWVSDYIHTRIDEEKSWGVAEDIKKFAERNVLSEEFQAGGEDLLKFISDNNRMNKYRDSVYAVKKSIEQELHRLASRVRQIIEERGKENFARNAEWILSYVSKAETNDSKLSLKSYTSYVENPESALDRTLRKDAAWIATAKHLTTAMQDLETYRAANAKAYNSCKLTLKYLGPLRLLGVIAEEMNEISAETGLMLLSVTKLLLGEMVKDSDAPFVMEKAGTRYQHAMVDEFQDTSRTQWQSIRSLMRELSAQGQQNLIVGDVKQSIYRWRGGDWDILQKIDSDGAFYGGVDSKALDKNYRSRREIVEFVGRLFPVCACLLDGKGSGDTIQKIYQDTQQNVPKAHDGGYVRLTLALSKEYDPLPEPTEQGELPSYCLPVQIRRLYNEGVPYEQMAILVRKNAETQELLEYFSTYCPDIPLISEEAFQLASSPAVQLVVNALRLLHDRSDTVAACYCARTWKELVLGEDYDMTDLCAAPYSHLPIALSDEAERIRMRRLPLYELCERIISLFGLDTPNAESRLAGSAAFLLRFQDSVLAFLKDYGADIGTFLTAWDERIAKTAIPSAHVEGVMIQTIHKSKGLEYHTVFVPFCTWEVETDRPGGKEKICWWKADEAPFNNLPLVPVGMAAICQESAYTKPYENEHLQQRVDNLNMAYVAFTRPQCNLLVWGAGAMPKSGGDSLADIGCLLRSALEKDKEILPIVGEEEDGDVRIYEKGTLVPYTKKEPDKQSQVVGNPFRVQPEEVTMTLQTFPLRAEFRQSGRAEQFLQDPTEEQELRNRYIGIGNLYHHLFEQIRTTDDIAPAVLALARQGILPTDITASQLENELRRHIEASGVAGWFDGSWRLYNERSLLFRDESGRLQTRRPDRVMQRGSETVIVDFKFATPRPEHEVQIREYADLLHRAGYADVRAYLWYVYRNLVMEVDC